MSIIKLDETCDTVNNFSVYQNELNKKNKQIIELENKIKELTENKNNQLLHIEKSNNQSQINFPLSNNISFQNNISHNHLLSLIQILQQENDLLKNKLSSEQKIEDKYSNTIQYKLLSAKNEIENLKKMNTNKDNIIMNMQNFINNINKIISNENINLNLDQIDIKTFIVNLKELERQIISKIQKIPQHDKNQQTIKKKNSQTLLKNQIIEQGFNNKKFYHKIPIKKKSNNKVFKSSFNRNIISNKTFNKSNFVCPRCCKNKSDECNDVRCIICRNKSKKNEQFYKERKKLRLKGFLLTKPEGIYSRTPKKQYYKSLEGKYYEDYLKTINSFLSNVNDY